MDNAVRYIRDMYEWKKRNNIPNSAKRPKEKPEREPGEGMYEYSLRLTRYYEEVKLWKTAPNVFDYGLVPTIEDFKDYMASENQNIENRGANSEKLQEDNGNIQRITWFKVHAEGYVFFILLVVLMATDAFLGRFDWLNIIFYPFLAAVIFVMLHGFIMPILCWFMNIYKTNEHKTIGNIINISIAMLVLALIEIPKVGTTAQKSEEGDFVYICTGVNSETYHDRSNCKGLKHCSGEIVKVDVIEAIDYGRISCSLCCE